MTAIAMPSARGAWPLDPTVVFLNHGSFGACPTAVLEHQQQLRLQLEREPVRFFLRELEPLWDQARLALAEFVGADPDGLVSVPNATTGVNAVLHSLPLAPGDEILLTNQTYPACRNTVHEACERLGAVARVVDVTHPPPDEGTLCDAFLEQVNARTKVALIDHIASPTGVIFPVQPLAHALRERGVRVLVDGAHAPGMVPLELRSLDADYYVGNCHKWTCAPKGAGFLYVSEEHRDEVHPVVVSLGYRTPRPGRSTLLTEFGWTGTGDPTPFLTVPFALRYVSSLHPEGWAGIRSRNHQLVTHGLRLVAESLEVDAPLDDGWYGSMAAVALPDRRGGEPGPGALDPWQRWLFDERSIEVPIVTWPRHPHRLIRVSAHLYNEREDFEALAQALRDCRLAMG